MRSTTQGAGNIIQDSSLVLYLDAANQKSYPGTGNTWYDLTANKNNFTLFNNPTNTGVGFTFDGVNQYAQCINNTLGNFGTGSFTLEYIFNLNSTQPTYGQVISKRISNVSIAVVNEPGFYYNPGGAGGVYTVLDGTAGGNNGNWYLGTPAPKSVPMHVTHVTVSNGVTATVTAYHKGVFNQSMTHTYLYSGNINNTMYTKLMSGHSPVNYAVGTLYLVRAYSKALSAAEVLQNYQALKPRFFGN